MKTSLIVAALAAALITGSTATSQAIPVAPLSKSIQQSSASFVEHVGYRGVRRVGVNRGFRRAGLGYRGYRRVGIYRGYRPLGVYGYRGYRRAGLYRGYRWGGVAMYRNRGCW